MIRAAVFNNDALSPTPRQHTMRFIIVISTLSLIFGRCCVAKLSDKRLCYDKDCSVVISTGRTTIPYYAKDPDLLSFPGNVQVKVLSKAAGSRNDLWGVEINGKRGYVPKNFIRENSVFKKDLKHTVPVETVTNEPVQKDTPKSEVPTEIVSDNVVSPEQVDESKAQEPKDDVSGSSAEDDITPHQVTPAFESIYDGTILPQEIDEIEPVTPSISIQLPEDSAKAEDEVQLNLYPNILSSTFNTLSNMFSGDNEPEDHYEEDAEGVELASSKKAQTEETTTKTPEILDKPEESSPQEKPDRVFKNAELGNIVEVIVEETVPEVKIQENLPQIQAEETVAEAKVEETISEVAKAQETLPEAAKAQETLPEAAKTQETQPEVAKTEETLPKVEEAVSEVTVTETVQEGKISEAQAASEVKISDSVPEAKINEPVETQFNLYPELKELYEEQEFSVEQVANSEIKFDKEPVVHEEKEISKKAVSNEGKVTSEEQIEIAQVKEEIVIQEPSLQVADVVKENADIGVQTESDESKSVVEEATVDTSTDKSFHIIVGEGENAIEEATDNVPNEETVYVTQHTVEAEKEVAESIPAKKAISSEQENVVDSDTFSTENDTHTLVSSHGTVLDKETDEVNDTLVNSATVEESIIPEVPSKQETKEESVTTSSESFIPQEPLYQLNILSNDSISGVQTLETSENLTAPNTFVEESKPVESEWASKNQQQSGETVADSNNNVVVDTSYTTTKPIYLQNDSTAESADSNFQPMDSSRENIVDIPSTPSFGEFLGNRNLLNAGKGFQYDDHSEEIGMDKIVIDGTVHSTVPSTSDESLSNKVKQEDENISTEEIPVERNVEKVALPVDTCDINSDCSGDTLHQYNAEANAVTNVRKMTEFNSDTLLIVCITAVTTLLFSLGYYFLENRRRDAFLIAKINKLEANLMKTEKECFEMQEKFTSTKTKLDSIEDESFGSNEMVTSLKFELASSENVREELESQIASLEKELESTSEAGLELERMLREILSSQSEENNPLAQSIEELQTRLNDQQVANDSLKTALTVKTQENENLTGDLIVSIKKIEQLQAEVTQLTAELKSAISTKHTMEESLSSKVQLLEIQVKSISEDKNTLRKQLKLKELEVKELLDVVDKFNSNNLDYEKLYDVSKVKAEAAHLIEERDELRTKISDEEGARQLLEEHVRLVTEEVAFLSEQCKATEKDKVDAKKQLEVLKNFFEERETQRQREEKQWLEKQGEHSSTVERLQTMQNEILNYKQQIEMLKREILDQEKEYKNQIGVLETKAHEHWVTARQNERRLEEVKAESSQLRNRLTLVEKNINDADSETKMHRLQASSAANGEPERTSLYPGGETSSSPLMFVPGGPPPPLPPYHHLFPPPPFLPPPPPPENSRPPPLGGGRLSSPPPHHPSSASNPAASPPLSPPPHLFHHLPPPHLPPPPLPLSSTHNSWGDEPPPPPLNANPFRSHGFQRPRNHKGSLHSSGESLDKSHHSSKV